MVLLVALTSVGAVAFDDDECVVAQAPPPPTTTSVMTAAMTMCCLLKAGALRRTRIPFIERGRFLAKGRVLPLAGSTLTAGCTKGSPRTGPDIPWAEMSSWCLLGV